MKRENLILKYAVGIDIAKEDFKTCLVSIDNQQKVKVLASRTFKNNKTAKGLAQMLY